MGNRGNRSQGLTTEAKRLDGGQIIGRGDFTGGMAFKGHSYFALRNAGAIIRHAEITDAAIADFDCDSCCTCIQTVLHHFLDGSSRAFDDLAGSNLSDDVIR